ncbi:hypothetical protein TNCV_1974431 [Trichonephila clavipes]|nr:hypothetical protein TNCV_1974431 [Trichonephila clavipes]
MGHIALARRQRKRLNNEKWSRTKPHLFLLLIEQPSYLSNVRVWSLDHLTPSLPAQIENVVNREFIESSTLEQVFTVHPGMVSEWEGLVRS